MATYRPVECNVSYVTILADDIWALSDFYQELFGLDEVELKTEHYRGLDMNGTVLSFSAPSAYDMLGLEQPAGPRQVHGFVSFTVPVAEKVAEYTDKALALGATLAKEPHTTYYGAWLSVLKDPEGNAFRIYYEH